jgi:hypothetical protein
MRKFEQIKKAVEEATEQTVVTYGSGFWLHDQWLHKNRNGRLQHSGRRGHEALPDRMPAMPSQGAMFAQRLSAHRAMGA